MVNSRKAAVCIKAAVIILAVLCAAMFTLTNADAAAKFKVSPAKATVYAGHAKTLKSNKSATKWSSSSRSVARLSRSKGKSVKVKGIAPGKVIIKARYKKKTRRITITVKKALGAVTVKGSAAVGGTLTAAVTPAKATAAYQWFRIDGSGTAKAIDGAANITYAVQKADLDCQLYCTAVGTGYYTGTAVSAKTAVIKENLSSVTVTGNAVVGETVTAAAAPQNATAEYQWYRTDKSGTAAAINKATDKAYLIQEADSGYTLHCAATGTGEYSGTAVSAETAAVRGNIPITSIALDGTKPVVGDEIEASTTPNILTGQYTWYADGTKIAGTENASNLVITKYLLGKKISCSITGTGLYYGTATSEATDPVAENGDWTAFIMDAKDGDSIAIAHAGDTMYAGVDNGASDSDFVFQWYKNGIEIQGAAASTYAVPPATVSGAMYTVEITPKSGSGFSTDTRTSVAVAVCTSISRGTVTVDNITPTLTDTITAAVTSEGGTAGDLTDHCIIYWYVDEIDEDGDNRICEDADGSIFSGAAIDLSGTYYDGLGNAVSLTGHKLIPKAVGSYEADDSSADYYDGYIEGSATSAVTE